MTMEARIRGDIEARIRSGEWPPGTRIPFEHQLVVEYGCARATIADAAAALIRWRASVQGTWPSSHVPGASTAKSACSALGTAPMLIHRASTPNGSEPE